jgi:hypothetical protein
LPSRDERFFILTNTVAVAAAEILTEKYQFADDMQEVGIARHLERQRAQDVIADRNQNYIVGGGKLLSVDALSTAEAVTRSRSKNGVYGKEYKETLEALKLDCQRLVGEWYRKKTWEYFPIVRHDYDERTGEYYSHGLSVSQMTENALVPMPDNPEEQARRVNERVEEATPRILRALGGVAIGETKIRTISECTDKAESEYQDHVKAGVPNGSYGGYVPEISKLMIRDISLDDYTGDRHEEQIGLPGTYINHFIIQEALRRRGLEAGHMDKTDLHGNQIVAQDDILDFVAHLDEVASEQWCVNIFMGELVEPGLVKNYQGVKGEALVRAKQLKGHSDMVADFVLELSEAGTPKEMAPKLVEDFVRKMLLNMAKHDDTIGEQIFDEKTATGLKEVARLESIGKAQQAFNLMQEVEESAPSGGYCGAGSCGLELLDPNTNDVLGAKKLGFKEKDTIKDTERRCKCGEKTILYDLKQNKKGCTSCGKTAKY